MSVMSNHSKSKFLGLHHATASAQLKKQILFQYVCMAGDNQCFRCGKEIKTVADLSIEHKQPWLGVSVELFWDLENIAFSHLSCNSGAHSYSYAESLRKTAPNGQNWCTGHKAFHPVSEFWEDPDRWNGLRNECKAYSNQRITTRRQDQKILLA